MRVPFWKNPAWCLQEHSPLLLLDVPPLGVGGILRICTEGSVETQKCGCGPGFIQHPKTKRNVDDTSCEDFPKLGGPFFGVPPIRIEEKWCITVYTRGTPSFVKLPNKEKHDFDSLHMGRLHAVDSLVANGFGNLAAYTLNP